ncbi:MAG: hypothetical protein SynsKO_05290 [Synoicihabitans sp.]
MALEFIHEKLDVLLNVDLFIDISRGYPIEEPDNPHDSNDGNQT